MGILQNPVGTNKLLNAIPNAEWNELQSGFERVRLRSGDVISHPIVPATFLYFPEDCIISNLTVFDDGASVESGIIGNEGMTGTEILLSGSVSTREACVQTSGYCLRIEVKRYHSVFERSPVLKRLIACYASAFFDQVVQVGACSSHHSVSQRLARLLLMCIDRSKTNQIKITHDHIAQMLCVHRPSVTLAASALKDAGSIDYVRGSIAVIDRKKLSAAACECYQAIAESHRQYLCSIESYAIDRSRRGYELPRSVKGIQNNGTREWKNGSKVLSNRTTELTGDYFLCVDCHDRVLDESGEWKPIDAFLSSRLSVVISSKKCPACSEKSFYNGAVAA